MNQDFIVSDPQATDLVELDGKLKTILPEAYQECYEEVRPVSMGSAGLKYDSQGRVAWDEIWGSFCDLAMAGGPPHRGTLLEPATKAEIDSAPRTYWTVVDEICRGIRMVTDLAVDRSPEAGWVQLFCKTPGMAGWMTRAIVMENISASADGSVVKLPAGPQFRVDKEIKNVVTSVAKTAHYFVEHTGSDQRQKIGELFEQAAAGKPLLQPAEPRDEGEDQAIRVLRNQAAAGLRQATGLGSARPEYEGWLGLECRSIRSAIWMMRALVVHNTLARREGTVLYIPINPALDPNGESVVQLVVAVWKLAVVKGVVVVE